MKKKAFLAVMAMALALTACGTTGEAKENGTQQQESRNAEEASSGETEAGEDETASGEETGEAAGEQENGAEAEESGNAYQGNRLVSVEDLSKYLTLGEYKGIELERTVQVVTDEDVELRIQAELEDHREEVGSGGTVQNGDLVTINFVGTKDGVAFDGGTANNYDLVVGQGGMIEGFEDGIIGMKKGETKDVPLTFPEGYSEPSLAGQDVNFQITLQNFRRAPELTEAWVKKNTESATLDEYRESIRALLEQEAEEFADSSLLSSAWSKVSFASEVIEYPQKDIDNFINQYKKIIEMYASQAGMDLEQFIQAQGYTEENFEKDCRQYAEYVVKQNMIVQAIMDAEGLSLNDPECLEIQDQLIEENGAADLAELLDTYGQESVDQSIGLLRVENFIVDNAVISDLVADGDMVGVNENGAESQEGDPSSGETAAEGDSAPDETVQEDGASDASAGSGSGTEEKDAGDPEEGAQQEPAGQEAVVEDDGEEGSGE